MLPVGAWIAIGLFTQTAATGLSTVGNIVLSNGIQQVMLDNAQKKQQMQIQKTTTVNNSNNFKK